VAVDLANIRSGPGTSYPILWQAERYYPVEILAVSGQWARFRDYEKDQGWIHKELLEDIPTVVTKVNLANVRSGPGKDNPIVFRVENGVPFRVLEKKGAWLKVRHRDGEVGWIHSNLVW